MNGYVFIVTTSLFSFILKSAHGYGYLFPYILGYGYLFLAEVLIFLNITTLWDRVETKKKNIVRRNIWHPSLLGMLELIMYFNAFLAGKPEYIGVWLTAKTVPQINYWKEQRTLYNFFLIGNAFVLLFAYTAAKIVEQANKDNYLASILGGVILIVFGLITQAVSQKQERYTLEPYEGKN